MKKTFYSLLVAALFSIGSLCAHGAEVTAQAIVLSLTGTAHYTLPGQSESMTVKVGDKLPQGATLVTDAGSQVNLQTFNGAVATISAGSTVILEKLSVTTSGGVVTKQSSLLNLKVGGILSKIDPANHNINDYSIRGPKGVAAARGTVYFVKVNSDGSMTVTVLASSVDFVDSSGATHHIPANQHITISLAGVVSVATDNDGSETTGENVTKKEADDSTGIPIIDITQIQSPSSNRPDSTPTPTPTPTSTPN